MIQLKQSESTSSRRRLPIMCVDANDGITPETGLTFSAGELKISKNGASEVNHSGTITEVAGGLYYYEATDTELDTLGFFSVRVAKTGVRSFVAVAQVVALDPNSTVQSGVAAELDAAQSELSSVPGSTGTIRQKINALWAYFRNRKTVTSSAETLYKEDASTELATATVSDNGTVFDKGELN